MIEDENDMYDGKIKMSEKIKYMRTIRLIERIASSQAIRTIEDVKKGDEKNVKKMEERNIKKRDWKTIGILSDSEIKVNAVKHVFEINGNVKQINVYKIIDDENQVEQPMNEGGELAAKNRLYHGITNEQIKNENDMLIVLENYMISSDKEYGEDHICAILYNCSNGDMIVDNTFCAKAQNMKLFKYMIDEYYTHPWGCTKAYGTLLHEMDNTISPKDWMSTVLKKPRKLVLEYAIGKIYDLYELQNYKLQH